MLELYKGVFYASVVSNTLKELSKHSHFELYVSRNGNITPTPSHNSTSIERNDHIPLERRDT